MTDTPIFIAGVPRSGSTWTANILSKASDAQIVMEPDNESMNLLALIAKRNLPQIPYITNRKDDPHYYDFWERLFRNRFFDSSLLPNKVLRRIDYYFPQLIENHLQKKSLNTQVVENNRNSIYEFVKSFHNWHEFPRNKRKVIKSVHSGLSIKFLAEAFHFQPVIIFRHPASVVASCLKLQLQDGNRQIYRQKQLQNDYLAGLHHQINKLSSPISLMAAQVGIHYYIWEQLLNQYPDWIAVKHETLCENPQEKFYQLFQEVGLSWDEKVETYIRNTDKKGSGFDTERKTKEEIDKWKTELTSEQIAQVKEGYSIFPVESYSYFLA